MTNKYRNYAMDPRDVEVFLALANDESLLFALRLIDAANGPNFTHEMYTLWMREWKKAYLYVSTMIVSIKRPANENIAEFSASTRQKSLNYLRKITNTLINARQFVIDSHRDKHNV